MNIENCQIYNTENIKINNQLECKICEEGY